MKNGKIIGEIIEVSSRYCIAQSYELYGCPPIGDIVKCTDDNNEEIFGVVTNISTTSIDSGRRPNPKGPGFENVTDIYTENPEIEHLMKTEFNITFMGYKSYNKFSISIPPTPPKIFSFIHYVTEGELTTLFSDSNLIKFIVNSNMDLKDDVITLTINKYLNYKKTDKDEMIRFTNLLAQALPDQIQRITNIINNLHIEEDLNWIKKKI